MSYTIRLISHKTAKDRAIPRYFNEITADVTTKLICNCVLNYRIRISYG